jgi:tetratricopeptide (TPR) repeat protein
MHQRSFTDRTANAALWREARAYFARAGAALCPEHEPAFRGADVFLRALVAADVAAAGAAGRRETALGGGGGGGAGGARSQQRPLVARLLLEWGMALHFFDRAAGAKTAFFLAKRESGVAT